MLHLRQSMFTITDFAGASSHEQVCHTSFIEEVVGSIIGAKGNPMGITP